MKKCPAPLIYRYEDGSLTGYFSDHNEVLNSGIGTVEFDKDVYIEAVKRVYGYRQFLRYDRS